MKEIKKITREEFDKKMIDAFNGQFPNDITMSVPRSDFMSVYDKKINEELKEFIKVTIDNYEILVK